jgi:hypothetical protein
MIHMACLQQAGIPKFTKVPDLKSKIQNIQKKTWHSLGLHGQLSEESHAQTFRG